MSIQRKDIYTVFSPLVNPDTHIIVSMETSPLAHQCRLTEQALTQLAEAYQDKLSATPHLYTQLRKTCHRAAEYEHGSFIILVVGPVKSGKSTLVNLIAHAYVSPTHFLECTVRPSIISKKKEENACQITTYTAPHSASKVELIDAILDCIRGLEQEKNLKDISIETVPLTPENIQEKVALDLQESLNTESLVTSITTPGGSLMQDKVFVLDMPGFDGKYANADNPVYDAIAQRADLIVFVQSSNSAISKVSNEFLDALRQNNQGVPVCLVHNVFDAAYWRDKTIREQAAEAQKQFALKEIRRMNFNITPEDCFCINLGKVDDSRKASYAQNQDLQTEAAKYLEMEEMLYQRIISHRDSLRLESCLKRTEQQRAKLERGLRDELEQRKHTVLAYERVQQAFQSMDMSPIVPSQPATQGNDGATIQKLVTFEYTLYIRDIGGDIHASNATAKSLLKGFIGKCEQALNAWIKTRLSPQTTEEALFAEYLKRQNEVTQKVLVFQGSPLPLDMRKRNLPEIPQITLEESIYINGIIPYKFPPLFNRGGHTYRDIVGYLKLAADKLASTGTPGNTPGEVEAHLLPPVMESMSQAIGQLAQDYSSALSHLQTQNLSALLATLIPDKTSFDQTSHDLQTLLQEIEKLKIQS